MQQMNAPLAPRESKSEATKRRILDAAEEEFAAKGFDGARLANVARAAGVQQALIHHYFEDKEGLYREVLSRALGAMTAEGWDILDRFSPSKQAPRRLTNADILAMVRAFADLMVRFYAAHASVLSILRHEAQRGGKLADAALKATVKPQFEAIVKRLEEMRENGEVRADLEPRRLCIAAIGMASFPFAEEHFLAMVWPVDPRSPEFLDAHREELVRMIAARVLL
jgi:TetR/AcrR family transcriptional regulator